MCFFVSVIPYFVVMIDDFHNCHIYVESGTKHPTAQKLMLPIDRFFDKHYYASIDNHLNVL